MNKETNTRGPRTVLSLDDVSKTYTQGGVSLPVLQNASLEVHKGEMVALVGESGCGKSTLLHIAGLLDTLDSGSITIGDVDCSKIKHSVATKIRRDSIGFVYQSHHLLQEFSAVENVMMPQIIAGIHRKKAQEKAEHLLEKVGLKERVKHRPSELSGGEQQRTAIARALANDPAILLADEPTGNLDPSTSKHVFDVLVEYVVESGLSMFMVTHNHALAAKTDRILTFEDNRIIPLKASE
jgi:lipoprotein-releasing system ATP-binding protein